MLYFCYFQPVDISADLEYLLGAMCNENGEQRPELSQLLEVSPSCNRSPSK